MIEIDQNIGLWIGGVAVSAFIAVVTYYLTRTWPVPKYSIENFLLVSGARQAVPHKVEIIYGGHRVNSVTRTRLYFWNAGSGSIKGSDFASKDPLRIELSDGGEFLEVSVEKQTSETLDVKIDIDEKALNVFKVTFEYLNRGDGFVIDAYHTAKAGPKSISGTMIGKVSTPIQVVPDRRHLAESFFEKIYILRKTRVFALTVAAVGFMVAVFSGAALLGYIPNFFPDFSNDLTSKGPKVAFFAVGLIYMLTGLGLLWAARSRVPRSLKID